MPSYVATAITLPFRGKVPVERGNLDMTVAPVIIVGHRGPWAPGCRCVEYAELARVCRCVFRGQQIAIQTRVEADTHVPANAVVVSKHRALVGNVG